jgi:DNA repair photolyase
MNPIYEPAGRAREYSEDGNSNLALNIYDGCPHGCLYCYAPLARKCDRAQYHAHCELRPGIVEATKNQLEKGILKVKDIVGKDAAGKPIKEDRIVKLRDKSIFLCFTCDPFPAGISHEPTYQIIELIKEYGNSVQILTKNYPDDMNRLSNLLDANDRYGITYTQDTIEATALEPNAANSAKRYLKMSIIKYNTGCQTFVSCEPVVDVDAVYGMIKYGDEIDQFRIGKLNYEWLLPPDMKPDIDWGKFGREAERLCKEHGRKYLIKADLRNAMSVFKL